MTTTADLLDTPSDAFERQEELAAAEAAWQRAIHASENWFGRLAWLASCRSSGSDHYSHPALASLTSPGAASDLLRESHRRMFYEWLGLSLEIQCKHVAEHLASSGESGRERLKDGLLQLVPSSATVAERELFRMDLEFVLCLTEKEHIVASDRGPQGLGEIHAASFSRTEAAPIEQLRAQFAR